MLWELLCRTLTLLAGMQDSLATERWCKDCIKERGMEEWSTTQWTHTQQQKCIPQSQSITCQHLFQLLYVTVMSKVKRKQMGLKFGRGFQQGGIPGRRRARSKGHNSVCAWMLHHVTRQGVVKLWFGCSLDPTLSTLLQTTAHWPLHKSLIHLSQQSPVPPRLNRPRSSAP